MIVVCAKHLKKRPEMEFICIACGRCVCGVCEGADDDLPDHCDDCWLDEHQEDKAEIEDLYSEVSR